MITFALFTLTMITGIVGRYLVFNIPRNQVGRDLTISEVEAQLSQINQEIEERFQDRREGYTMMLRVDQLQNAMSSTGGSSSPETTDEEEPHDMKSALKRVWSLWRGQRDYESEIEAMRKEVGERALPGEVSELLKLFKRRARLKSSARRARWVSLALKSYRVAHVGLGQVTFLMLLIHILHALKVFTF